MSAKDDWKVPLPHQPVASDYDFDIERVFGAMVGLRSQIPATAFSAETLGTERSGHGVFIDRKGLVLTIGYLITEAETVWLSLADGRAVQADVVAYDQESGFGLVQALARLDVPFLEFGNIETARVGDPVLVAGAGGKHHSLAGQIVARQEFAGHWEYAIEDAMFVAPAHPNWGGTALVDAQGKLIGIGSLQLEQSDGDGESTHVNLMVPISLLLPILNDLRTYGRRTTPPRAWLGLYASDNDDGVVIVGLSGRGPAQRADLRVGDVVVSVGGRKVSERAEFFRSIWAMGPAGTEIPMVVTRDGKKISLRITSADRSRNLMTPRLH